MIKQVFYVKLINDLMNEVGIFTLYFVIKNISTYFYWDAADWRGLHSDGIGLSLKVLVEGQLSRGLTVGGRLWSGLTMESANYGGRKSSVFFARVSAIVGHLGEVTQ